MAEDAWNTRDPARVALAYTTDSRWRNRAEFLQGREAIEAFLMRKWNRELDYRLIKEVWTFRDNRIAVRFAYEWHDDSGHWFRSCGNENWEFDEHGLMRLRIASINDLPIKESERKYHWALGRRPHPRPAIRGEAPGLRASSLRRGGSAPLRSAIAIVSWPPAGRAWRRDRRTPVLACRLAKEIIWFASRPVSSAPHAGVKRRTCVDNSRKPVVWAYAVSRDQWR